MLIVVKPLRLDKYDSFFQPSHCLFKNVIFCTINHSANSPFLMSLRPLTSRLDSGIKVVYIRWNLHFRVCPFLGQQCDSLTSCPRHEGTKASSLYSILMLLSYNVSELGIQNILRYFILE